MTIGTKDIYNIKIWNFHRIKKNNTQIGFSLKATPVHYIRSLDPVSKVTMQFLTN